jgi:hypothetical protein
MSPVVMQGFFFAINLPSESDDNYVWNNRQAESIKVLI